MTRSTLHREGLSEGERMRTLTEIIRQNVTFIEYNGLTPKRNSLTYLTKKGNALNKCKGIVA